MAAATTSKPFWLSKTFWTNLVMLVGTQIPALADKLTPDMIAGIFGGMNILLRLISKDKVTLN